MKPTYFCKLLCLLLTVVFLTGCTEKEFDPETDDYAVVEFHRSITRLTNAEGQELHWSDGEDDSSLPFPQGTMAYSNYTSYLGTISSSSTYVTVPYSKSFTARPEPLPHNSLPRFSAQFIKDGKWVSDIYILGDFDGDITIRDDNVVELEGDGPDITADFSVYESENPSIDGRRKRYLYILKGSTKKHAKLSLTGNKIVAEGMVGDYMITKYEYPESVDCIQEKIYTKTYSEDGKEKVKS